MKAGVFVRKWLWGVWALSCLSLAYADGYTPPYTPPAYNPAPAGNMPTTTAGTSTGSSDLLQYMNTQTQQALQVFQGVNYQKFSDDKNLFFSSQSASKSLQVQSDDSSGDE